MRGAYVSLHRVGETVSVSGHLLFSTGLWVPNQVQMATLQLRNKSEFLNFIMLFGFNLKFSYTVRPAGQCGHSMSPTRPGRGGSAPPRPGRTTEIWSFFKFHHAFLYVAWARPGRGVLAYSHLIHNFIMVFVIINGHFAVKTDVLLNKK